MLEEVDMVRARSERVEAQWRGRLERFGGFEGTVVEFCEREEVSTASFYQWHRRLEDDGECVGEHQASNAVGGRKAEAVGGRNVSAASGRKAEGIGEREVEPFGDVDGGGFRAVRVLMSRPVAVELAGGVRIEVPTEDLEVVRTVVGEVLRIGRLCPHEERSC